MFLRSDTATASILFAAGFCAATVQGWLQFGRQCLFLWKILWKAHHNGCTEHTVMTV